MKYPLAASRRRRAEHSMKILPLLLLGLPLLAQVEAVKFRYGDDPRWAGPAWDDSGWNGSENSLSAWSWARYKVRIPERILDPVLGLPGSAMEVYVEGRRIGRHGKLPPEFEDSTLGYSTFAIPPEFASPGRLTTVAVRMWDPPGSKFRGWARPHPLTIHSRVETPIYERNSADLRTLRGYLWSAALMLLVLVMLGVAGRDVDKGPEFRLVVVFCGVYLVWDLVWASAYFYPWARGVLFVTVIFSCCFLLPAMDLISAFAGVRLGWPLRAAQVWFVSVQTVFGLAGLYQEAPRWLGVVSTIYMWTGLVPALSGIAALWTQRTGGPSRRIFPLILTTTLGCVGIGRVLRSAGYPTAVTVGDSALPIALVGHVVFGIALLFGTLSRLRRTGAVALQLQGQMAAARSVQEALLQGKQPVTPGYVIDPVYQSAEEVGGDLFRILPASAQGTLLVVGDVSGKGLKSAMLVSVIVGALLNRRSSQPAEVLEELNRAVTGQLEGGFVTCCAALFEDDGRVRIANAGHLPPYLDGVEFELPPGLPLGLMAEASYESRDLRMSAAGQLTLISDGVVEAENGSRELFGFDRTREIAMKSAREIADTARAWGQSDDITVVTVRRNP